MTMVPHQSLEGTERKEALPEVCKLLMLSFPISLLADSRGKCPIDQGREESQSEDLQDASAVALRDIRSLRKVESQARTQESSFSVP